MDNKLPSELNMHEDYNGFLHQTFYIQTKDRKRHFKALFM